MRCFSPDSTPAGERESVCVCVDMWVGGGGPGWEQRQKWQEQCGGNGGGRQRAGAPEAAQRAVPATTARPRGAHLACPPASPPPAAGCRTGRTQTWTGSRCQTDRRRRVGRGGQAGATAEQGRCCEYCVHECGGWQMGQTGAVDKRSRRDDSRVGTVRIAGAGRPAATLVAHPAHLCQPGERLVRLHHQRVAGRAALVGAVHHHHKPAARRHEVTTSRGTLDGAAAAPAKHSAGRSPPPRRPAACSCPGQPPPVCGGLWPNVDPRVVPPQQVLDEGALARAVLPQQQHAGLGLKVALAQQRAAGGQARGSGGGWPQAATARPLSLCCAHTRTQTLCSSRSLCLPQPQPEEVPKLVRLLQRPDLRGRGACVRVCVGVWVALCGGQDPKPLHHTSSQAPARNRTPTQRAHTRPSPVNPTSTPPATHTHAHTHTQKAPPCESRSS